MADETVRRHEAEPAPPELLEESKRAYQEARVLWRLESSSVAGAHHLRRAIRLLIEASARVAVDGATEGSTERPVSKDLVDAEVFLDDLVARFDTVPQGRCTRRETSRYEELLAVVPDAQRRLEARITSRSESGARAATTFLWVTTPLVVAGLGWILVRPAGSWRTIPTAPPVNGTPTVAVPTPPSPQRVAQVAANLPPVPESRVSPLSFPAKATPGLPLPANGIWHRFVLDGDEGKYDIRITISGTGCSAPNSPPSDGPYAVLAVNVDGKTVQTLQLHTDGPEEFVLPKVALDFGTALDLEMSGDLAVEKTCDRNLLVETLEIAPSRN